MERERECVSVFFERERERVCETGGSGVAIAITCH